MVATKDIGAEVATLLTGPACQGSASSSLVRWSPRMKSRSKLGEVLNLDVKAFAVPRAGWAEAFEQFGIPKGHTGPAEEMFEAVNAGWMEPRSRGHGARSGYDVRTRRLRGGPERPPRLRSRISDEMRLSDLLRNSHLLRNECVAAGRLCATTTGHPRSPIRKGRTNVKEFPWRQVSALALAAFFVVGSLSNIFAPGLSTRNILRWDTRHGSIRDRIAGTHDRRSAGASTARLWGSALRLRVMLGRSRPSPSTAEYDHGCRRLSWRHYQ